MLNLHNQMADFQGGEAFLFRSRFSICICLGNPEAYPKANVIYGITGLPAFAIKK
jgi:hypothetical protein